MIVASLPLNETERLAELYASAILDTAPETDFNNLVELAGIICNCNLSVINFVDASRQWGKAMIGFADTASSRAFSMCAHTILQNDVMQVEDTLKDERFFDNPNTTEGGIRFYAGATIRSQNGFNLGSICVCDTKPRTLSQTQTEALKHLSRQAAILLELRKQNKKLEQYAKDESILKENAILARKAQEHFLSTMSHEIRTPLNGIIGMVHLLQTEEPRQDQKPYLDALQFSSGNLLHLVNDILDYNKINAGKISLEPVPFNLHQLLEDIGRPHALQATEKGIAFLLHIETGLPQMIVADPLRLTQVLNNLIGNAVKFTLKGSVTVTVGIRKSTANAADIFFEIKDTGIGFSEAEKDIIFEQFLQANKTTTRRFGGTGLGLSITRQLVGLMGASINVISKPDEGSSFSFVLPVALPANELPQAGKGMPPVTYDLSGMNVLVVDDNAINIMITSKMLQRKGVSVTSAANGKECLALVKENRYDLLLLDVHMPVMDGITALNILRTENTYTGPVILLTADVFIKADTDMGSATYFDGYLTKPFTATELYHKIAACRKEEMH
jgi:two-component system, sensor histidine kinase